MNEDEKRLEIIANEEPVSAEPETKPCFESKYLSGFFGLAANVCAAAKGLYQKAGGLKQDIDARMALAREIRQAEKYSVADLKQEELSVVGKIKQLDSIVAGAGEKLQEYRQVLEFKEKDFKRMKQKYGKGIEYRTMNALRDKIYKRRFEIEVTKSVILHYQNLLEKVK